MRSKFDEERVRELIADCEQQLVTEQITIKKYNDKRATYGGDTFEERFRKYKQLVAEEKDGSRDYQNMLLVSAIIDAMVLGI